MVLNVQLIKKIFPQILLILMIWIPPLNRDSCNGTHLTHTHDNMVKSLHQLQKSLELDQRTAALHLIKSIATQEQFEIGKSLIENIYST